MTVLPLRCRTATTARCDRPITTTPVARQANHVTRTTHRVTNHDHLVRVSTAMSIGAINHSATFVMAAPWDGCVLGISWTFRIAMPHSEHGGR